MRVRQMVKRRRGLVLLVLLALLAAAVTLALTLGAVPIAPGDVWRLLVYHLPGGASLVSPAWTPAEAQILLQIRLPRVVLAALVGAALSIAGAIFQGLFRNPLAGPYVLGIASGAALGAVVALATGLSLSLGGLDAVPLLAFLGAILTLGAVYGLSRVHGRTPGLTILLAGIAMGSLASALVSLVITFTQSERVGGIVFWLMGGLGGAGWAKVWAALPYVVAGGLTTTFLSRALNALLLGDEPARHLGVEVEWVKRVLLVTGALLTGAAVAVSGVIGFVGLVVPHVVRIVAGPDHRLLVPMAALAGATFLVAADTLARTVLAPRELQVGVVTALVGAPFFIYLLRQARGGIF